MPQRAIDIGVTEEFLRALGEVSAYYAVLEGQIEFLTWSIMGRDQRLGQIVTAELSFRNTATLLTNVFRHRCDDELLVTELDALVARALTVSSRRDTVVHSRYAWGDAPGQQLRMKTTARHAKGIKHVFEQISVADVEAITEEIIAVHQAFMQFTIKAPASLVGRQDL